MTVGERAAYHSIQCGQVFARAAIAKNPRITRVVVEKPALSLPPLKNIGGLEANMGGIEIHHPLFSLYSRTFPTAQSA